MAAESYRYALLGVVGLVALVAVFTIIKTTGSSFTTPDDNVLGMGSEDVIDAPAPTYAGSGASGGSGGGLTSSGSPSYACGSRASQPYFCNGDHACCGGSCVELPSCESRQNGPVFTCGSRPMYCCDEKLSLKSCGIPCDTKMDCPTLNCIQAPCPQYACVNHQCLMQSDADTSKVGS